MRCFLKSLRNNDRKWTIQQNELQPFKALGSFNLVIALHLTLIGVYDDFNLLA